MALAGVLPTDGRSKVDEWKIEPPDTYTASTTSRLSKECIAVSKQVLKLIKDHTAVTQTIRRTYEKSQSSFVLWDASYGVSEGKLDEMLGQSRTLAKLLLEPLISIGTLLSRKLIPQVDTAQSVSHRTLDDIIAEAKTSLHIDFDGSSDSEESESDSSTFTNSGIDWDDAIEDLKTDVQCLIELDLIIRYPAPDFHNRYSSHGKKKMAPDWEPHLSYSDKIANRFPDAASSLVDWLARANWERFKKTNATREENIAAAAVTGGEGPLPIEESAVAAVATGSARGAQTYAASGSKFHDSGLGDSIRTGSSYADTIMTYQAQGRESVRIPSLPQGAKEGNPFDCVACGRRLVITNNSTWKQHLYLDLCPWICHDVTCQSGNKIFESRKDWVDHLALGHGLEPEWTSFQCPLCLQETGGGKNTIWRHLSSHLEEISLAALPVGADEDAEDHDIGSNTESSGLSSHVLEEDKDSKLSQPMDEFQNSREKLGIEHPGIPARWSGQFGPEATWRPESVANTNTPEPDTEEGGSSDHGGIPPNRSSIPIFKKLLDAHGQTYLARACARGEYEVVKMRLSERPQDLNVADYAGNTPLQIAAIHGREDIVNLLLDAGCNLDCVNYDKDTPLLDAVDNGHLEVVKVLLDAGVNPRKANINGEEPIERVTEETENKDEIRAALIEARKRFQGRSQSPASATANQPLSRTAAIGRSAKTRNDLLYISLDEKALRQAAARGDEETVARILQVRDGCDDPESMVAAARGGHEPVIQLLLGIGGGQADPEPVSSQPEEFATPMLAAIGQGNIKVLELLLSQRVNPTRCFKGETYYQIARRRNGPNWEKEEEILKDAYDAYKTPRTQRARARARAKQLG